MEPAALVKSPTFENFSGIHCTLGIDEAGRGPVLGPMVYSLFVCKSDDASKLTELKVADSKTLTEETRENIFAKLSNDLSFGYLIDVISPERISTSMLSRVKISLNEISHNSAIAMIRFCLEAGLVIDHVFIDTVGLPEKYELKLKGIFPSVEITVSKKADSLFPVVSAASICAKVARDRAIKGWAFKENISLPEKGTGSGYPGDPMTKSFLRFCLDPVFGYPSMVRFSWETAKKLLQKHGIAVEWEDDEEPAPKGVQKISTFFGRVNDAKQTPRNSFFIERGLSSVTKF